MRIRDWSSDVCSADLRRRCVCRTCRLVKIRTTFVGEQFVGAAMAAIAPTCRGHGRSHGGYRVRSIALLPPATPWLHAAPARTPRPGPAATRSDEHTSELQSLMRTSYAVFCLKQKTTK